MEFPSRRSVVHSTKGMAASTQPLATAVAVKLLEMGCNAAEAAVGCSAALGVVEPGMTSLGDAFCLYYNQASKQVEGLNGSGKSSHNIDLAKVRNIVGDRHFLPYDSAFSVNVPGAAAAWVDIVETWGDGHFSLAEILAPAIELARNGFPVSKISARIWKAAEPKLKGTSLLVDGERAPAEGEIFVNEDLARTYERIAERGKHGFYEGPTADAIVEAVQARGGVLDHKDLSSHTTLNVEPVHVPVPGAAAELWELPPNNQGVVALLTFNIVTQIELKYPEFAKAAHNSPQYIHMLTEALKFAFKEAEHWVADPEQRALPPHILSEAFAAQLAELFDPSHANVDYDKKNVIPEEARSDTSYYTVVDAQGNACSMISSLYHGFGSGIVPKNLGFALHNRGCNFSLNPASHNALGPSKRSYHTIIPAMLTCKGDLLASYGVMGGFMQPQGHVQVALNLLRFKLDPQSSLDAPRICLTPATDAKGGIPTPHGSHGVVVNLEEGFSAETGEKLKAMGHVVQYVSGPERALFGRGQVILRDVQGSKHALHAGSDPRGDGAAMPQV